MKQDFPCTIGGRTFRLQFAFAGVRYVERTLAPLTYGEIVTGLKGKAHLSRLETLFFAATLKNHKGDLKPEDVEGLFDSCSDLVEFQKMATAVYEAMNFLYLEAADTKKNEVPTVNPE